MAGCRSLTDDEIGRVYGAMDRPRDRALFVLGLKTGFRIKEILSLMVGDILSGDEIADKVTVSRANMKGKVRSRTVALHSEARLELQKYLIACPMDLDSPLFPGYQGKPLSRFAAHAILKKAYEAAGLTGGNRQLATHCMRKTFANKAYVKLGKDMLKTARALGYVPKHGMNGAELYIEVRQDEIDEAICSS